MAAKLQCVKCHRVLKERGDHAKVARGEYDLIYDGPEGRALKCLACGHEGPIGHFEPLYVGKDRWSESDTPENYLEDA